MEWPKQNKQKSKVFNPVRPKFKRSLHVVLVCGHTADLIQQYNLMTIFKYM